MKYADFVLLFEAGQKAADMEFRRLNPKIAHRANYAMWAASEMTNDGVTFQASMSACDRSCCGEETHSVFLTWDELTA